MADRKLGLGDPDYEFPKEVQELLVAANSTNITLSEMADSKASILMGASFVVFSISIGDIAQGHANLAILVLTAFSFIATVFGVLCLRPSRLRTQPIPVEKANILFFGSYANISRDAYVDKVIFVLTSEEATYRKLAEDLYDHGKLLRDHKFRWLYWSFTAFLFGMLATAAAVVFQLVR